MADVIELNDKNFKENLADKELALVDIHASWCGPCRLFAPVFAEVSKSFADKIYFYKIDGDENPNCRDSMTIENLPFVAAFKNGKFVRGISTSTKEGLLDFIKNL